jgi:FkbM family methyltransferase
MALHSYARSHGCSIRFDPDVIQIRKRSHRILVRARHAPYARDVIDYFDLYFESVESRVRDGGMLTVDFSTVQEHRLRGFDLLAVTIPGLPEPWETVEQYIRMTGMKPGETVIDLGAYSGVTSLAFQEVVGSGGRVIAVEADPVSASCASKNFAAYRRVRGYSPLLIEAAVWSSDGSVRFTAEGNLGSAVNSLLPRSDEAGLEVRALTLSQILDEARLHRVDVLKADIEGAEYFAFMDSDFFRSHHPVLIFEPAQAAARETQLVNILELLDRYGYSCQVLDQKGSRLPLVLCK